MSPAAGLVEKAGDATAACALLRDAEDWAGLADLVVRQAPALASQGRHPTVVEWIDGLPAAIVDEESAGLRSLYVALTRATRRLSVVHARALPDPMRETSAAA